eukprot:COSAG06_NODE_267_length_18822_cov_26.254607_11_plen_94_part_00
MEQQGSSEARSKAPSARDLAQAGCTRARLAASARALDRPHHEHPQDTIGAGVTCLSSLARTKGREEKGEEKSEHCIGAFETSASSSGRRLLAD